MTDTHIAAAEGSLPIVIVGHVDHGKSTLIGRLLIDTGALPEGKLESVKAMARRRRMPFEWSFVMDAFQAERDQGITIDTTRIAFQSEQRRYVIIDAPGHKEFLKNMITGAASAEAALLVVDAEEGVQEQTRRHAYLLNLLGVDQVAVIVNKMDLIGHDQDRFRDIEQQIRTYLTEIGIAPSAVIPISARHGDMIAQRAQALDWFDGPTVLEALDGFEPRNATKAQQLRLPIQDVYKFDHRRLFAGRIESGRLTVGDTLTFAPDGKTGQVASIESWNTPAPQISAVAGQSVAITLRDDVFIERGALAHHQGTAPRTSNRLYVRLFWLGADALSVGETLRLKIGTNSREVQVQRIDRVIDVESLQGLESDQVPRNGVAEVELASRDPIAFDEYDKHPKTGRGVLIKDYDIVAGCIVLPGALGQNHASSATKNIFLTPNRVDGAVRAEKNGHRGGVIWLTGLSGAGKTTLAMALEAILFDQGYQVVVLDGDNLRHGLNGDLGFSAAERTENIRRTAEVARLFQDAGTIAIVSLISPTRDDRDKARDIVGPSFHEVHVHADLSVCEGRDPKGLYAKARSGALPNFTGVDAPYEAPTKPELHIDTGGETVDQSLQRLLTFVENNFSKSRTARRGAA